MTIQPTCTIDDAFRKHCEENNVPSEFAENAIDAVGAEHPKFPPHSDADVGVSSIDYAGMAAKSMALHRALQA